MPERTITSRLSGSRIRTTALESSLCVPNDRGIALRPVPVLPRYAGVRSRTNALPTLDRLWLHTPQLCANAAEEPQLPSEPGIRSPAFLHSVPERAGGDATSIRARPASKRKRVNNGRRGASGLSRRVGSCRDGIQPTTAPGRYDGSHRGRASIESGGGAMDSGGALGRARGKACRGTGASRAVPNVAAIAMSVPMQALSTWGRMSAMMLI